MPRSPSRSPTAATSCWPTCSWTPSWPRAAAAARPGPPWTWRQPRPPLGEEERESGRPGRLGVERGLTMCEQMLETYGYEPVRESPTEVRLRNCPFHPLAAKAPELVCGMNHAFLDGYLRGLEVPGVEAVLDPVPGECCVRLQPAPPAPDAAR
ncbi:hypothetical protein ACFQ1I_01470 [Kitasatospora arboriphila]